MVYGRYIEPAFFLAINNINITNKHHPSGHHLTEPSHPIPSEVDYPITSHLKSYNIDIVL
jgi:hypothetical protein